VSAGVDGQTGTRPAAAVGTERLAGLARGARRDVVAAAAGAVVAVWVVAAVVGWRVLTPRDPALQAPSDRFARPGPEHWLGADQFGRDVLARVLAGARPVLVVAPLATVLAVVVGTVIGLSAAGLGGWYDGLVMRVLDAVTVFPSIIAATLFAALVGRSRLVLILVIAATFVPIVARSVRAATLVECAKPYVEAARLRGEPTWSLLIRELLPNVRGTVLVEATSRLGDAVFAAATLSFLGLGEPPGSPEWGATVSENRVWLTVAPWTLLAPALAIASLVVAVALLADAVRRRIDA